MPTGALSREQLAALVRTVPDFPIPGILFRDVTTLIADSRGLASAVAHMGQLAPPDTAAVAGIEARGFVFGAALAVHLGLGFVPVRKAGKLPIATHAQDYALEYGSARLEIDAALVPPGGRVLLVDDLLATGGTALAAATLLRRAGALCDLALFVIDLPDLGGAKVLDDAGVTSQALLSFPGH